MAAEPEELLEALRSEATAFIDAAAPALDLPVPACPGWDVRQLVNHMGRVHRWATAIVRSRAHEAAAFPPRPEVVDTDWFVEGATELVAALEEAGVDTPVWTMPGGDGTSRFWLRRQAVETAVHRWDAQQAVGSPAAIDTELALTGIDEALDVFLAPRKADLRGSVHLHTTDSEHGEWLVADDPDGGLLVGHGHDKGDVALRGAAGDLLLWIWGRDPGEGRIERFGDEAILERWRASLALG